MCSFFFFMVEVDKGTKKSEMERSNKCSKTDLPFCHEVFDEKPQMDTLKRQVARAVLECEGYEGFGEDSQKMTAVKVRLLEITRQFSWGRNVWHAGMDYLDRYMKKTIPDDVDCVALGCLWLASKYHHSLTWTVDDTDVCEKLDGQVTAEQFCRQEVEILKTLDWDLSPPTLFCRVEAHCSLMGIESPVDQERLFRTADELRLNPGFCRFGPRDLMKIVLLCPGPSPCFMAPLFLGVRDLPLYDLAHFW